MFLYLYIIVLKTVGITGEVNQMKHWIFAILLVLPTATTLAQDWVIQNQHSRVSFVTTKQGNIAEVNHFADVSGTLTEKGRFSLFIPLIGVQTGIDTRNERMQSMLFEVAKFPEVELKAQIEMSAIKALGVGEQQLVQVNAEVALHGKTKPVTVEVMVARLNSGTLTVSSFQPIVINAGDFDLSAGVEKLRQVAGLQTISEAVPVSFVITFSSQP